MSILTLLFLVFFPSLEGASITGPVYPAPPRTYPPRFGVHLRKLHQRFCSERVAEWNIPKEVMDSDTQEFFGSLEWGDLWEDANMVSTLAYIRASRSLHLGSWRCLFPTHF